MEEKELNLSELVQFLSEKFEHLDKRFDEMRLDFSSLQTGVDAYAKKADTYFQEMVMLSHKVNRHERWLQMMADRMGVHLEY